MPVYVITLGRFYGCVCYALSPSEAQWHVSAPGRTQDISGPMAIQGHPD